MVFVDGLRVAVRTEKGVVKKCVYTVLGVGVSGKQEVLGLWIEETEGARFWLKVFNDLKARGIQDILILCGDGLTGLPEAVLGVPRRRRPVVRCASDPQCDQVRLLQRSEGVLRLDAARSTPRPTIEAAELALERFDQAWGPRYPMSVASWRNHWAGLTAFFKYPVELRQIVYTTNAIESLHSQMRKNIANRKMFPNDDAVIKILFLNIRNFSNRWSRRQGWDIVMNQLAVMFGDRLKPEVRWTVIAPLDLHNSRYSLASPKLAEGSW